ncbi:3-methyl-2-oxobutanoate hydroxymethyltransferase [Phakopsora pachyrhizi]|nr:3-methyl-2-oxobutanoate hydroxymethyltransferase [Phakopsora pachyrhizi]
MLTAHDFSTARMVGMSASSSISNNQAESSLTDRHLAGIDICLVGDSLAMVSLGYSSTTELGFDEFSSHVQAVRRGLDSLKHEKFHRIPILVADLPFGSYEASLEQGVRSAIELSKRARVDGFKIEGGPEIVPLIRRLTSFGMSVFGHIGLTPQRASSLGGFKVQGHDSSSKARQIISDALLLQDSGCVALVLEAIPTEVVHQITTRLSIPTIGIGAGPSTDGQVLVLNDLIGALDSETPKFVPKFEVPRNSNKMSLSSAKASWKLGMDIVNEYVYQVRTRQFPVMGQHTYKMKPQVLKELDEKGWI